MNNVAPQHIDGRPGLLAFARNFHPRHSTASLISKDCSGGSGLN